MKKNAYIQILSFRIVIYVNALCYASYMRTCSHVLLHVCTRPHHMLLKALWNLKCILRNEKWSEEYHRLLYYGKLGSIIISLSIYFNAPTILSKFCGSVLCNTKVLLCHRIISYINLSFLVTLNLGTITFVYTRILISLLIKMINLICQEQPSSSTFFSPL